MLIVTVLAIAIAIAFSVASIAVTLGGFWLIDRFAFHDVMSINPLRLFGIHKKGDWLR